MQLVHRFLKEHSPTNKKYNDWNLWLVTKYPRESRNTELHQRPFKYLSQVVTVIHRILQGIKFNF